MITIQSFSVDRLGDGRVNDLAPVVCREYPEVGRHLEWLQRHGQAMMTGSGACVFAAFRSIDDARCVMEQLPPDMRGFMAQGLERHPLREFAR